MASGDLMERLGGKRGWLGRGLSLAIALLLVVGVVAAVQTGDNDGSQQVRTAGPDARVEQIDVDTSLPEVTIPDTTLPSLVTTPTTAKRATAPKPAAAAPKPAAVPSTTTNKPGAEGLYVVAADGSGARLVVAGTTSGFDWAPDAKRIAYSHNQELWVANADGTNKNKLVAKRSDFYLCCGVGWNPKADVIAFIASNGGPEESLWLVKPDGSELRKIADRPASGTPLAWSHDGTRLAFTRAGLEVYDLAAATLKTLVSQPVSPMVSWSPDDSRLVFMGGNQGAMYDVIDADGSNRRSIAGTDKITAFLQWAPSGETVLFSSRYEAQVWSIDVGTGAQRKLLDSCDTATWANNGRLGLFLREGWTKGGGTTVGLYSAAADGTDRRKLAETTGKVQMTGLRWAPDSRNLLVRTVVFSSP
ncbi:MAG TPA: hypothetical protein VGB03_01790, partial [Acidimicrobiales bacterium]|jgi:Tol biopolymer transport system component